MESEKASSDQSGAATELAAERIAINLDRVALRLEKLESQAGKDKPEKPNPWYLVVVQFLGIPAALLALTLQFYQVRDTGVNRDKTVAETQKINAEELKTRAELQKALDDIAEKRALGMDAYNKALDQSLPKIREALQNLNALRESASFNLAQKLLVKFIIIWVVFQGLGLVQDMVGQIVGVVFTSSYQLIMRTRIKETTKAIFTTLFPLTLYIPSILFWAVRLFLFGVIVMPFVYEVVVVIGGNEDAAREIADKFIRFHFSDGIALLGSLLGLGRGAAG
jgi:hypothetical protein